MNQVNGEYDVKAESMIAYMAAFTKVKESFEEFYNY